MTVPGTIAAFYADATAAFVLTSSLDYIIEPRTPLFQNVIPQPRASHFALAQCLGEQLATLLGDPKVKRAVRVPSSFFTVAVAEEIATNGVSFQRNYGGRAPAIQDKLSRYARLLAEARGRPVEEEQTQAARPPALILAPYFVFRSPGDDWWNVNQRVWSACEGLPDPSRISPVVAVENLSELAESLRNGPQGLSRTQFFWVTQMDERRLTDQQLDSLWAAVSEASSTRDLINLYGGFFSICLSYAGLWGFNNALGYSESRSWPDLPNTGAAPARYYVRDLHMYVPPGLAQHILDTDASFRCPCGACEQSVLSMGFHQLKAHFALARKWELELVAAGTAAEVANQLADASQRFEANVGRTLPPRTVLDTTYLDRWAAILNRAGV